MNDMLDAVPPVIDVVTKGTDWPTIVTGVVGLAGIIGTYWQGKRAREATSQDLRDSLNAETDRALTIDRRVVYARFLAAINKTTNATFLFAAEWVANEEEATRLTSQAGHIVIMSELYAAAAEVKLIAPAAIGEAATAISNLFNDYRNALINDEEPDYGAFDNDLYGYTQPLYTAMRADLGVSVKPDATPPPSS
jgi:hypothetical protein